MQRFLSLMPRLVSGVLCSQWSLSFSSAVSVPAVSWWPLNRRLLSSASFLQDGGFASFASSNSAFPRPSLNLRVTRAAANVHRRQFQQNRPRPHHPPENVYHRLEESREFQRRSSVLQRPLPCRTTLSTSSALFFSLRPPAGNSLFFHDPCCATKMGNNRTVTNGPSGAARATAAAALSPAEKVAALRELMRQHQVDAYIVFSADAHGSEMPSPCDGRREFLTNFDGSSGVAVVTQGEAVLWTDGRYFVQAEQQLDLSVWKLMKQNTPGYPKLQAWLASNQEVSRVGVHGWSTPAGEYTQLLQAGFLPSAPLTRTGVLPASHPSDSSVVAAAAGAAPASAAASAAAAAPPAATAAVSGTEAEGQQQQHPAHSQERRKEVIILEENLVDQIWGPERPPRNLEPLVIHPLKYAGESTEEKLQKIVAQMCTADVDVLLLSALDDVAWLLNLRGSDIPWTRSFYSYCLIVRHPQPQQQRQVLPASAAGGSGRQDTIKQTQQELTNKEEGAATAEAAAQQPPPLLVFYVHEGRVAGAVAEHLAAAHVRVRPYSSIAKDLRLLLSDSAAFSAAVLQQQPNSSTFSNGQEPACAALGAGASPCVPVPIGGLGSNSSSGSRLLQHLLLLLLQQQQNASMTGSAAARATGAHPRMVWMDPAVNVALYVAAHEGHNRVMLKYTPAAQLKAVKNAAELEGMKEGHITDGVVLCKFFVWLEQQQQKNVVLDEWTAAKVVDTFRKIAPHSQGPSFPTIASVDANAAIVHYRPRPTGSAVLNSNCTFLLDSGGFYGMGCTTDVTRTVHTAQPPDEQRRWFTLILKGFIALSRQSFPQGTRGPQLDALARQHLWSCGVDYRHGTGHGVGSLLNVHEGPIGISPRLLSQAAEVELDEGNVLSIEPGYYVQDAFGIRVENLAFVKRAPSGETFKDTKFFQFEQLTMVPIQKKFIIPSLLFKEELEWLNNYHAQVWNKLSPRLKEEEGACTKPATVPVEGVDGFCVSVPSAKETLRWLKAATEPLVVD